MFLGITNTPRDYAWGSRGAISALLGNPASAGAESPPIEAELWLGAHPGSPSRFVEAAATQEHQDLAAWIAADPTALGAGSEREPRVPFLLKVLAAASPLSLQAHPTADQAAEGFAREEAAGVPLTAPERNYKDRYPKPEIIYALEDGFEAFCGFRPLEETHAIIARLIELDASAALDHTPLHSWLAETAPGASLRSVFERLISGGDDVGELVKRVVAIARAHPAEFADVVLLADAFPGDPGIVISLMLNRVTLDRGEVLYLPAGNIHAYVKGIGVELMTASDNVLRGGLTSKHVDVTELLRVLDFRPLPVPYEAGKVDGARVTFHPAGVDFELEVITGDVATQIDQASILLCTGGGFAARGARSSQLIRRGESFFVTPDEGELLFTGSGTLFLATSR